MKTNEVNLSHEESLALIQSMINTAKNKVTENGFHFLLWGVLVIVASLTQYIWILMGGREETNMVWIGLPVVGVPVGIIYEKMRDKKQEVRSMLDGVYTYLWLGFGISLGLTIFITSQNNTNPLPYIMMLMGLATFVSGAMYEFKPLLAGGIIFWIAAAISSYLPGYTILLLNAGATFLGYIVPGILLWKNAQSSNV